jgi:hypothetical protein
MDVRAGGKTLAELARLILDNVNLSTGPQFGMSAHALKEQQG